jgi:hypothetical protein
MTFLSISAFIPSGKDFEASSKLFQDLGFELKWSQHGYAGFEANGCSFILQQYDAPEFAQNLMLSVRVSDINEFKEELERKELQKKYPIKIGQITQQPYGKELNVIDLAGVCWHFVE